MKKVLTFLVMAIMIYLMCYCVFFLFSFVIWDLEFMAVPVLHRSIIVFSLFMSLPALFGDVEIDLIKP